MERKLTKREERIRAKYPETETFKWHNVNFKGKITGDCVVRAIALASGIDWKTEIMREANFDINTGYIARSDVAKYLEYIGGWEKHKMPKHEDGTRYTVRELAEELKNEPCPVIVSVANHLTCVVNGQIRDLWDCGYKCVGNYWTKKGA